VIDEEAEIRESLEHCCNSRATSVSSAATGVEGLTLLANGTFDICAVDLALPDKNGMDYLAEIHMLNPLQPSHDHGYGTVEMPCAPCKAARLTSSEPWTRKLLADVRAAVARQRAVEENVQLKRALKQRYDFDTSWARAIHG